MLANWALLLCQENVAHYSEGVLIAQRASALDAKNADVMKAVQLCGAGAPTSE